MIKFGNLSLLIELLAISLHTEKSSVCERYVKIKIYTLNFLYQEFVNMPLNFFLTIDERCHKKYISSELRFPNKTVHLLSKLFYYSIKISSISTKIE